MKQQRKNYKTIKRIHEGKSQQKQRTTEGRGNKKLRNEGNEQKASKEGLKEIKEHM